MAFFPRALVHDLRGAFKLLEEPLFNANPVRAYAAPHHIFNTPFFNAPPSFGHAPNSTLREEGSNYLLEAEVPGYKRGDIKVEISDGGEVLHISGTKGKQPVETSAPATAEQAAAPPAETTASSTDPSTSTSATTEVVSQAQETPSHTWASEKYGAFSNTFVSFPLPLTHTSQLS
jgi:hypothetical protein